MNSKRYTLLTTLLLLAIIFSTTQTIFARSVYVINDTDASQMQAYNINGTSLTYQTNYNFVSEDWGPVGIAIDESDYGDFLFVTFEDENEIELVDAKTMEYIDNVTASGASNLAGIAMDMSKGRLYVVDRYTNHLYSYSWNPATKTLTPDFDYPYYIQLEGLVYGSPKGAFGIALDEGNGRLYVADNTNSIKYYNTNDPNWPKMGEVNNVSCNVISVAIDVSNQLLYYGSMGGYGEGDPHLYKYNISSQTESSVNVGCSVAGIAVNQATGLVYLTTYGGGDDTDYPSPPNDRLMIYNSNLVKQSWESGDIGNPTGVAVVGNVSYKPPLFYLEKVDVNEPNGVIPDDYITYRITYGPNGVDHNNVVITDYLPDDVEPINPFDPNYNPSAHTYTWNIGHLDANDPCDSVALTVKVNECISACGTITNYCEAEIDSTYNTAEASTPVCSASHPWPTCGEIVDLDTGNLHLTWCPGHFAADVNGHEVYFGSNFNDVHDANNSWPLGGVYKGPNTNPSYPLPLGSLDKGTTYYWRIDEVNTNHPGVVRWRGGVWSFKTGNYFVVENFNSYAQTGMEPSVPGDLKYVWKDYETNNSGAVISLQKGNLDANLVCDGNSMKYDYGAGQRKLSEAYANTAALPSGIGSNWKVGGVKALALWFYGKAGNDANEQMYVKLTDSASKTAKVVYSGDADDVREAQWHEWNIALQEFVDACSVLNLANVSRITIGFGNGTIKGTGRVYFDDIRLYLERCIPGYYPAGDFDSNCDVVP